MSRGSEIDDHTGTHLPAMRKAISRRSKGMVLPRVQTDQAERGGGKAAQERPRTPSGELGSLYRSGKEYIVKSGRQRYCPDCAAEAVREVDREASKQWNKENGFYEKRRLSPRNGVKICVICGKPVPAGTPSITCSEECDRLRLRLSGQNVRIRNGKRKTEPTISRLDRPAKEKEKE